MNIFLKISGVLLVIFIAFLYWNAPEHFDGGKHLEYYTISSDGTYNLYLKADIKIPQIVNLEHIFYYNPNSKSKDFFNEIEDWNSRFIEANDRSNTIEYSMEGNKVILSSGLNSNGDFFKLVSFKPSNLKLNQFISFSLLEKIDFPDKKFTIIIDEDSGATYMNITVENKLIHTITYF